MNALQIIENEFSQIGYSRSGILIRDYSFADVLAPIAQQRSVALAAFTQTPASYRTAAFGVVCEESPDVSQTLMDYRSLGAPVLLSITGEDVTVWQVHSTEKPRNIGEYKLDQIPALFAKQSEYWAPAAIHRAKSIGAFDLSCQLDFVDIGLLPAIEGEIHVKLDRLLQEVILGLKNSLKIIDYRTLFQGIFRLLAAKILQDREHQHARSWDSSDIGSILSGIANYYQLGPLQPLSDPHSLKAFSNAWRQLMQAISFRNISADDLAFVYENTLITPETRKIFGTHSTPRQVAEYVVGNLGLSRFNPDSIRVYEPFSGAGVFLVSAIRHIRDLLPGEWDEPQRHKFLTERIQGSEIDPFACEVSMLSLILADYPNSNGWHIQEEDLFIGRVLSEKIERSNVILCNPPFEDFTTEERTRYQDFAARSIHKPIAILDTALDSAPDAIGFVLPRGFVQDRQYAGIRQKVEKNYETIEVVSLPDRVFQASAIESTLLIARDKRAYKVTGRTNLISTTVSDADRTGFLSIGKITSQRHCARAVSVERIGQLWLAELNEVWDYLSTHPTLGSVAEIHRGLEWNYPQARAGSHQEKAGFRQGLLSIKGAISQFLISSSIFVDCNRESMRGHALYLPWAAPKVIANAVRLTRGPWRFAACPDLDGLVCSQQFFGIWPFNTSNVDTATLSAILNGPLANAYLSIHSPTERFRVGTLKSLPIPNEIEVGRISKLVEEYQVTLSKLPLQEPERDLNLNELILEIDAAILLEYDLPPRLERTLLEYFRGHKRPVSHPFDEWFPEDYSAFIPLHEYIETEFKKITGRWVQDVFEALTPTEAKLLQDYVD